MNSNNLKLNCVVIEDEEETRKAIIKVLNKFSGVDVIGEAGSIDSAFNLIASQRPDMAFLDMKLIGGEAFVLLERLKTSNIPIPYTVVITGHQEYAVQALCDYGNNIVYYLLKPALDDWQEKFGLAIDKVLAAKFSNEIGTSLPLPPVDHLFINVGLKLKRVNFSEIFWVEVAEKATIKLITEGRATRVNMTLAGFLRKYSNGPFMQINRNQAVNVEKVLEVNTDHRALLFLFKNKKKNLSIGDAFYKPLIERL